MITTLDGKRNGRVVQKWYTAKNINATDGSRTAIAADLKVGDVVIEDPYTHEFPEYDASGAVVAGANYGKGSCVTRPQTNHLHRKKWYVVDVPSSVNDIPSSAAPTQRRGGYILVSDTPGIVQVNTLANMTAGTTGLGVANGAFSLAAVTIDAAGLSGALCAIADETVDTSGGAAVKKVEWRNFNGTAHGGE